MRTFMILSLAVCATLAAPVAQQAAPAPRGVPLEEEVTTTTKAPVPILRSINKVNDDGSYTFGYEAGDGSFRVERKELNGYVKGKYGYIDEFGVLQVLEYESGKAATGGKSLGFQATGALAPFPIIVGEPTAEQKALDFEYSSVDEDEDGIPDNQARRPAPVGVSASAAAVSTTGVSLARRR